MRRFLTLLILLMMGFPLWSQKTFCLEGTVGTATDDPEAFSLFLGGRMYINSTLSTGIGLGLWNSGYTSSWFEEYTTSKTATLFRLSDNQTAPSFSVNLRVEKPLITVGNKPLLVFVEPGVYFLPLTGRTVTLSEEYFKGTLNPLTASMEYERRVLNPKYSNQLITTNKPMLGWELKGGLSLEVTDNVGCFFSCAYQQIDLFQTLRTSALNTHETIEPIELHRFFPRTDRIQLQLGFVYHFLQK